MYSKIITALACSPELAHLTVGELGTIADRVFEAVAPSPLEMVQAKRPEIATLITQGRRIQAIKEFREETRMSLKESKDAIDEWTRQIGFGA